MPTLLSAHAEPKPAAQMNLLDRLAGTLGPRVATRPVHFVLVAWRDLRNSVGAPF